MRRVAARKARTPPPPQLDEKEKEEEDTEEEEEEENAVVAPLLPSSSSPPPSSSSSSTPLLLTLTITLFALLVRHAVSLHSYSGTAHSGKKKKGGREGGRERPALIVLSAHRCLTISFPPFLLPFPPRD